ncbi:hypothetical protein O181_002059 [Austropuccinia psidii MF-1]|uniref:Uncharacterized protein n=1 Tax=Austropuccinia psidii MF-1 TaxID=1389203 RepID=A0A9Q3BBM3_9BASI|nr:hypothetical protein [Austropuccinia psidii MF-1]
MPTFPFLQYLGGRKWKRRVVFLSSTGTGCRLELLGGDHGGIGDCLTVETKAGLAVEGLGEGGGIENGMVERTGWKSLGVQGTTCLWNLLAEGWEGEVLDWHPAELSTTSTSSPSSSSLPSALGLVGESASHLILLTTPSVLILEMGSSELE